MSPAASPLNLWLSHDPRMMRSRLALRADLLDFTADPGWTAPDAAPGVRWRPDHWLLVEDGKILGAEPAGVFTPGPDWQTEDHRGRLLLPGFIDTHVHSPQLDVIASFGTELLDWLNTYTFPAELRHADPVVAGQGAEEAKPEVGNAFRHEPSVPVAADAIGQHG